MLSEFELSMRRARKRMEVLIMTASLTEATPRALAFACGIDCTRLKWIMEGHVDKYSKDLALVTLGLVEIRLIGKRKVYVITERGRRKARQLTARRARKAIARAANANRQTLAFVPGPVSVDAGEPAPTGA